MEVKFCTHYIMLPIVNHIEKYSSEKLFGEDDIVFLIVIEKIIP